MGTKKKSQLKVGVIGCGNIARTHLSYIPKYTDNQNIALCDIDAIRLEDFAQNAGISNTYTDVGVMLSKFKPDVVHIVTPPGTHKNIAVQCLQGGCHVLIEKPMCLSTLEADEIVRVAEDNNKMICVDHMRVLDPLVVRAKKIVDSGKLGEVINIFAGYSYDYFQRLNTDPAMRWMNTLPGGAFFDVLPHPLSVIEEFLPGLEIKSSVCLKNKDNVITDVSCIFTAPKGSATVHMSFKTFPLKNYIEFECSQGNIRVDHRNFLLITRRSYGLPNAVDRIAGTLSIGFQMILGSIVNVLNFLVGKLDSYEGLNKIIENYYHAISNAGTPPVPAEKGRLFLSFSEKIFKEDALSKQTETVELPELQGADVLVTGGTGFIGRRLVNQLLEQGRKVRILSHRQLKPSETKKYFSHPVEIIHGDIYSKALLEHVCQGVETVYHLAAAMKGDWNYHLDTTVSGTQNIVQAAEKAGVQQFVYASTLNVYDARNYPDGDIIDENFDFEPEPQKRGAYSRAKSRAEEIVRAHIKTSRMNISVFRPGLVYGPGGNSFLRDVGFRIGKGIVIVMGSGERKLPLTYVDNTVDALIKAASLKEKGRGIYNVIDHDYPTQRKFIATYKKLTNEKFFTFYVPLWVFSSGFWVLEKLLSMLKKQVFLNYKLDCVRKSPLHSTEKLKKALGWEQRVDFESGLANTIKAHK